MKTVIIKSLDRIIVFLLVTMGIFSSCGKDEPKPYAVAEYGVPQPCNYEKNVIINEETTQPTQDILVISEIDSQDENTLQ